MLRYVAFSPAKIIYNGFTRYGNACSLTESVHRLPREILILQGSHEIVPFVSLRTHDGQMIIQN